MKAFVLFSLTVCLATILPSRADVGEEARLAGVIQSPASANEKEDACWRLKRIGTVVSVPILATLLSDDQLCQAACDALQTMPFDAAGEALRSALKTTSGRNKASIIHALGERRNRAAVTALAELLNDPDPLITRAASRALGKISGNEAVHALRKALKTASDPVRDSVVDALLRCAVQLTAEGDRGEAKKIFAVLDNPREKEHIQAAAYAGLIRAAGNRALDLVVSGIKGNNAAHQIVALKLAREIPNPKATAAFTNLLAKASPAMQAALIGLLQQRGDATAAPAVFALAHSEDSYVRNSALTALGTLGDADMIPFLLRATTSRDEAEQKAARQALIALRRGKVAETLVAQLTTATPEVQVELASALAGRAEKSAVPRLLELARSNNEATRKAAFRALSPLADGSHLPLLVKLLEEAQTEATRSEVRNLFEAIVNRTEARKKIDVSSIVSALNTTQGETRIALLQVSALFADDRLHPAWGAALKDTDVQFRNTAARALCSSRDAGLMPDLLELARNSEDFNLRVLALEGYVRLASDESSEFTPQQRAAMLKPAYDLATRVEEKRLVLSALASVVHRDALELAEHALTEPEIKNEAEIACTQIAKALLATDSEAAAASLRRLAENGISLNVRTNAQVILKQFESRSKTQK